MGHRRRLTFIGPGLREPMERRSPLNWGSVRAVPRSPVERIATEEELERQARHDCWDDGAVIAFPAERLLAELPDAH